MDQLHFQIEPDQIPLGKAVDVTISVKHACNDTLGNLYGRLVCTPSIRIIGAEDIEIRKIPAEQEKTIRLRVQGVQPGKAQITFTRLSAESIGGSLINFNDYELEINVTSLPNIGPEEISLRIEPVNILMQNVIGRLACKLHNSSAFPIEVSALNISAIGCEIYKREEWKPDTKIVPGSTFTFEIQVIPSQAGDISFTFEFPFHVSASPFFHQSTHIVNIVPSLQSGPLKLQEQVQTILLISSAPKKADPLRTDKEIKNILIEMEQKARLRDHFLVKILLAATENDLTREIIIWHPYILHFAGHGNKYGIIIEDETENPLLFPTDALVALLKPLSDRINCVILNACSSFVPAKKISEVIRYVIGMRQPIADKTAIAFAKGFYEAIGAGHSIQKAFQLGKAVLTASGIEESEIPVLISRMDGNN